MTHEKPEAAPSPGALQAKKKEPEGSLVIIFQPGWR